MCANCGKTFRPMMYEVVYSNGNKFFCTYNCRAKWRKKQLESIIEKTK